MNANTPGKVAIFWDLDTCTPSYNSAGYHLVDNIRRIALNFGHVTLFKAYLEVDYAHPAFAVRSLELRTELQASGVSLTDCPSNSSCNILNQMLSVDLVLYATDHAGPHTTILLISGNRGLAYALSSLRLRNHQVALVCPSNTDPTLVAQVTARYDWNTEVLGKNTSVNPTPERAPPARPSARSRAFSTATNGYSAPGSRRAYTANETLDGDDSEDDFYMNDPTIFNNTTPFTNTTMNGPNRRSESPLPPWSGGPPLNPLRPRSESRTFSPAMSFRSAKTSILTTPPSGPVALPADATPQKVPAVNGHSVEETNGPADPIEPMFSASPEPIIPKKPAVVNNLSSAAQPAPATQTISPPPPVENPPKVPDPFVAAPAPQLATPNASNESTGKDVVSKAAPMGVFNNPFFPSQFSTVGQGSTTTPAPAPVQAATTTFDPFASTPTSAAAPVSAASPAASKAPAPVTPAINGAPITAASSKPVVHSTPAPAPAPTAKPATSTPAPVAKPTSTPAPAPVAKPATSTPAPAPAAKPTTPPTPSSPPAKTPKKKKSTTLSTSAPAFVAAGPQPSPPKAVAAHWRILIDILEQQRQTQGQVQIGRSIVGSELAKHKPKAIYEAAGTSSFPAWIKKAEEDGIVETGGPASRPWISLRPEWRSNSVLV